MERRRRTTLGLHASAALPVLWAALVDRGWSDAEFARQAEMTSGGASKVIYGDVMPGGDLRTFCNLTLGVPLQLWMNLRCPVGERPHDDNARRELARRYASKLAIRVRGRPAA